MMNDLTRMTEELYRIFDMLNAAYYNGELEPLMITLQKTRANNLGHFTLRKTWENKETGECRYEININPLNLNRTPLEITETLHHEMVHYWNTVNGIKDCNGQIHNKKFKNKAEEVGLECEQSKKYGYGFTKPTEAFIKFVEEEIKPNPECFQYYMNIPQEEKPEKTTKKRTFKYICPNCGTEAKAKPDLKLMCGFCKVELEIEED